MKLFFKQASEKHLVLKRRRNPFMLVFFFLFLSSLGVLLFYFPPTSFYSIGGVNLTLLPVFFFLLFGVFFSAGAFLFKSKSHGILFGLFIVIYLILRINNLTHPFFLILLFALFLTLELMVSYRK